MPYRLLVRRVVLEVIEILTISIQPAHADGEEDSPQRRKGREEEKDTDLQDSQDAEDSDNLSGNPVNP